MIYLDNAATTPVRPEALEAMLPYFDTKFGNASTVYALGHESREALKGSREKVASVLHAKASEVYFTSGGSESDNWALKSVFELRRADFAHPHIITSVIEHHAVLNTCRWLESQGAEVTYLPVDAEGFVDPDEVEKNIRPETVLISVRLKGIDFSLFIARIVSKSERSVRLCVNEFLFCCHFWCLPE